MDFIKDNLLTIVLVSLIIIIFAISAIFIYKVVSNDNSNEDEVKIAEIKEIITSENTDKNEEIASNDTNINESTSNIQENDTKLVQIANIFNSSSAAEEMKLKGYTMNATALQNGITVLSSGDGLTFDIQFILNNNILSTEIIFNQADSRISAIELLLAIMVVDSVGQMKGLPERTLTNVLGNDNAMNYTLENQGVELKQLDNNQGIRVRVDIESDFSNI